MIGFVSLWMARAGGVFLLLAAIVISAEIIARKTLQLPFNVGTELSTYALAIGASWSFAYALLHRAHVRIDILRRPLPSAGKAVLDILAVSSLAGVALILSWHVSGTVATSWELGARENTPLSTPLIIPQGMWLVGLLWFVFVCVHELTLSLLSLARGDLAAVIKRNAPAGAEEELEGAIADAQARIGADGVPQRW